MSLYKRGWRDAAHALGEPYPVEVFTALTSDEYEAIRAALAAHCEVAHPMDRMHAQWARHWEDVLLRQVDEGSSHA